MSKSLSLAVDIVIIFAVIYGLIAISVLVYGIVSVFTHKTKVFKDDGSSYGFSKTLTAIDSIICGSFKPFFYHRTMPRDSEELKEGPAILVGWAYIILGLLMLFPFFLAFIRTR